MSILIVGGDNLGSIPKNLKGCGYDCIDHIKGRKCNRCKLKSKPDMILVLTDYVNHNLAGSIKKQSKKWNIPTLFCRRSWSNIYKKLEKYN